MICVVDARDSVDGHQGKLHWDKARNNAHEAWGSSEVFPVVCSFQLYLVWVNGKDPWSDRIMQSCWMVDIVHHKRVKSINLYV